MRSRRLSATARFCIASTARLDWAQQRVRRPAIHCLRPVLHRRKVRPEPVPESGIRLNGNQLKNTGANPDRALLISVDLGQNHRSLSRTAALAREAAGLTASEDGAGLPPAKMDSEAALEEFRELVTSAGAEIVGEVVQRRSKADPATLVGSGKVEEIRAVAASSEATLILFDHDLSPTQQRNLEDALPCRVVDRT